MKGHRIKEAKVGDLVLLGRIGGGYFAGVDGDLEIGDVMLAVKTKKDGGDFRDCDYYQVRECNFYSPCLTQGCDGENVTELAIIEKGFGND